MELVEYRRLPINDFIYNYERALMHRTELHKKANKMEIRVTDEIIHSLNGEDVVSIKEVAAEFNTPECGKEFYLTYIEREFIEDLFQYFQRHEILYFDYNKHCLSIGKNSSLIDEPEYEIHVQFLEKKIEATRTQIELLKLKEKVSTLHSQPEKPKVKRNKLNTCERYIVAQKTIGLWDDIINKMDIRLLEKKYALLACILRIDDTNARKVVAGKYDCKVDHKKIEDFINSLDQ